MTSVLSQDFANNFETQEKQDEKRLRALVQADPLLFDRWLDLIKHVEGYKSPDLSRDVYRQFLQEFPQCFGYWRKLADYYIAHTTTEEAEAVFKEAFECLPVNVELWVRYCEWKMQAGNESETRR